MFDQRRIGSFIAACRKEKGLTQAALAERLGITDRAVSKWETGRSLPDVSTMPELCDALDISINELFSAERLDQDDRYRQMAEEHLLQAREWEETSNRCLLSLEVVIGVIVTLTLFLMVLAASYAVTDTTWRIVLIVCGTILFVAGAHCCLVIEHDCGYYECACCGNRYVPTLAAVYLAPHVGRSRWMRCPRCGKRSLQKKVLTR